jgi:ribosome-binding protein aMBF1 (putative translation factor)
MELMTLPAAIEDARRRLGLSKREYAKRVGLTEQGLRKVEETGRANSSTLVRLKRDGDVRGLGPIFDKVG